MTVRMRKAHPQRAPDSHPSAAVDEVPVLRALWNAYADLPPPWETSPSHNDIVLFVAQSLARVPSNNRRAAAADLIAHGPYFMEQAVRSASRGAGHPVPDITTSVLRERKKRNFLVVG